MAFVRVNGVKLYYEVYGEGAPLVLLHGNGEDHHTFDALGAALCGRYRIYAFDSRGHGQSTAVEEYHYADMAQDIADAMQQLFTEPVYLLGFSDGGVIALFLAIWYPQLVKKLILCGANYHPFGIREESRMQMYLEREETGNPLMTLMLEEPWLASEDLQRVQCPTFVVAAQNDVIEDAHTREIAAFIPQSHLLILEQEDHTSYVAGSDLLAELCVEFFC